MSSEKPVGVLGVGSFGTAMANILSVNADVIMYSRSQERIEEIQKTRSSRGIALRKNIRLTSDLAEISDQCELLFPMIPSSGFRDLMIDLSPLLRPYHILIHGTKGLDLALDPGQDIDSVETISRSHVKTMSDVIREETIAIRVGCLAGPNLAKELAEGHPAATVVASHFNEVIRYGQKYLKTDNFQVYGNSDLRAIELAGVLKNIIAIASGGLQGLGFGENARGMLISRGLIEIIYLGKALGGNVTAFLGLAGIGDLVTTANSSLSRNFTVGQMLARGMTIKDILNEMDEVAEGINTVKIMSKVARHYDAKAPITNTLYNVLFGNMTANEGLEYLMKFPMSRDIEFLKGLD